MTTPSLELVAGYAVVLGGLLCTAVMAREALWRWRWRQQQLQRVMRHYREQPLEFTGEERLQKATPRRHWQGHRKFRATRRVTESEQVTSFYLTPHDGGALAEFRPGQYLTFRLLPKAGQAPLVRCYSLSGLMTEQNEYCVTIKREYDDPTGEAALHSGSCFFHERVRENSILDVMPPSGEFTLDQAGGRPVVFIAAGIGLTPFLAMGEYLEKFDPEREVWLFYGIDNRAREVESERLRAWAKRPNFHLVTCYSDPQTDDEDECDERRRIDMELLRRWLPSSNYEFFLCAPPTMVREMNEGLLAWDVPAASIHFESFSAATVQESARENPAFKDLKPCEVVFRSAGKTLNWTPESGTLLELATQGGVPLPSGCRVGNCGSCATPLMKGEFRYLKKPTFPVAKGSCLACVAVQVGDVECG